MGDWRRERGAYAGRWLRTATAGGLISLGLLCPMEVAYCTEPQVPGLNELVIYDPGVHERGLPKVEFQETPDGLRVEIPPTIHVHRYFYSGDKEYQGPVIEGGPTIVVANHPKTGKRLYVDVMLPSGAPVIAYSKHTITYVYNDQRVVLTFGIFDKDAVTISHIPGRGLFREYRDHQQDRREKIAEKKETSSLHRAVKRSYSDGKRAVTGAVMVVGGVATTAVETSQKVIQVIPGVQLLQSLGDQIDERASTERIRQAADEQAENAVEFVRTVR